MPYQISQQNMYFGAAIFSCDIEIICKLQVAPSNGILEIQGWTSEQSVRSSALRTHPSYRRGRCYVKEKCCPMVIFHSNFGIQRITVLEEWNQKH